MRAYFYDIIVKQIHKDMTTIDFKKFRTDFKAAVKQLETEYGLVIDPANISYTSDYFTLKVNCKSTKLNADVKIKKGDWFHKIGGKTTLIVESVNGNSIVLFKKGNRTAGLYAINKAELLSHYSKIGS